MALDVRRLTLDASHSRVGHSDPALRVAQASERAPCAFLPQLALRQERRPVVRRRRLAHPLDERPALRRRQGLPKAQVEQRQATAILIDGANPLGERISSVAAQVVDDAGDVPAGVAQRGVLLAQERGEALCVTAHIG